MTPAPSTAIDHAPDLGHERSGELDALAFVADAPSEHALREGLAGYGEAQVWPGGLPAAVAALGRGARARVLFVDLDGVAYPAGAILELAAVCEVGTAVVALGSDGSARFGREALLAGVSDYLVKPVSAAAVREAAGRAGRGDAPAPAGCVAGFAGSGGSGASTLAAAVALGAAARGRYVSVLDLARPFPVLSFLLDVEPAAGLDQLLESARRSGLDPDTVDGVRARRGERIAVYAYRFGPAPVPAPPVEGVGHLLSALRHRSHLVLVDGLGHSEAGLALLAAVDRRVLVVEPTPEGAARAVRLLGLLGEGPPPLVVCNHTRAFRDAAGLRALRGAGLPRRPALSVPFEPTLPALCDQGWPKGQAPRALARPLDSLVDALLAPARGARAAAPRAAPAPGPGTMPARPPDSAPGAEEAPRRRSRLAAWWSRPRRGRPARPRPA